MSDDERIASILGEWQERRDRGEEIDPKEIVQAHPELADQLRAKLAALAEVDQALEEARRPLRSLPGDRYIDFKPVGEGGMGIVFWAIDTDLNREVAFKVIRPGVGEGEMTTPAAPLELTAPGRDTPASQAFDTLKQRFLQEAWVTGGLSHPGIVPVYELGQTPEGVPYYTMRFVKGERTLADAIEEATGMDTEERLKLLEPFLKVCDTLRYAHSRGVIHRDLKPENIAIGEFGEVVLLDWGLAKLKHAPELEHDRLQTHVQAYRDATDLKTIAGAMGTPGYMGPEGAMGRSEVMDERSDVYSLGVMLFEILTGRLPFLFETFGELARQLLKEDAPRAIDVNPTVPEALSNLCAYCLSRDMDKRPPKVDVLSKAIRSWQQESAARREVRGLMREADSALEGTAGLRGDALLRQLDRVTALSRRVLQMRPDHGRARHILHDCEEIRHEAIEEREAAVRETERQEKRRVLVRGAAAAVVLMLLGTAVAALLLDRQRRVAENARGSTAIALARMEEERNAKARALEEVEAERDAKEDALAKAKEASAARERALQRVEAERDAKDEALAKVQAERDAKTQALERLQAEQEAREAAEAEVVTERDRKLVEVRRKRALELVNASVAAQEEDAMRALLLAREAARTQMLPEVVSRLHEAIGASYERVELRGHERGVVSAVFSPDRSRVLTASSDGTARLWEADGKLFAVLREHGGPLSAAAFSPAGTRIVTASQDNTAQLWSSDGGALATLVGHTKPLTSAAFSPSGRRIVTGSEDGTARLWSAAGKPTETLKGHRGSVLSAVFSPNGDSILTASEDRTAKLWNVNGKAKRTLDRHRGAVTTARFFPFGRRILTTSTDGTARIWDARGKPLHVLEGHGAALTQATISPAADRILTASTDRTARLWDAQGVLLATLEGHDGAVTAVAFSPSGRRIFTASDDKTARVWDASGKLLHTYRGHDDRIRSLTFAASPDRVLTASEDGTARLWSLDAAEVAVWSLRGTEGEATADEATTPGAARGASSGTRSRVGLRGVETARLPCPAGNRTLFGFTDDGRQVFVVTEIEIESEFGTFWVPTIQFFDPSGKVADSSQFPERTAQAFSPTADRFVASETIGGMNLMTAPTTFVETRKGKRTRLGQSLTNVVFSPDGKYILGFEGLSEGSGVRPQAHVWGKSGRLIGKVHTEVGSLDFVALSPTGREFFTVTQDGVGQIWSLRKRKKIAVFPGFSRSFHWAGFSPTGDHLVILVNRRAPRLVRVDGKSDITLVGHGSAANAATFNAKGDRILTAGAAGTARLWDLEGNQVAFFEGHQSGVVSAMFNRKEDRVITSSGDLTARVWDLHGKQLAIIEGHVRPLAHAEFSPDGKTILTATDRSVRLWRLEAVAQAEDTELPVAYHRAAVSTDGRFVITCTSDRTPRLWNAEGLLTALQAHNAPVVDALFAPDRKTILGLSHEGNALWWDGRGNLQVVRRFPLIKRSRGGLTRLCGFLSAERFLFLLEGTAWLWGFRSRNPTKLAGHADAVLSATVAPNGNRVLTTSADGTGRLWNVQGKRLAEFAGHRGAVQAGAFSPNGSYVATASHGDLHIWDLNGKQLAVGRGHEDTIHAIAFSQVGDLVLTASADGTARLWDIHGNERAVLHGHDWDVLSAVFSPQSDRILTASKDETARLWDLQGKELAILRGHEGWVGQAVFLQGGKFILTCSEDGTARTWLADDGALLELAEGRCLRDFTAAEKARYADLLKPLGK